MFTHSRKLIGLLCAVAIVSTLATATPASARGRAPDIVDTVLAINARTGEFSTLIAALAKVDLVDALRGGPFTVFAPTDAAFKKLGLDADAINNGALPDDVLTTVLLYHVTTGRIGPPAWIRQIELTMLNGTTTKLSRRPGRIFINDSRIIFGLPVSNGVIYVIDTVLLP